MTPLSGSHFIQGTTLRECKEQCHALPGCAGVVTVGGASDDRFDCHLRSDIDPASCLTAASRFNLHLAPPLPLELWNALDNYSIRLYGVSGVLTDRPFRILWPALLPQEVLRHISPRCSAPIDYENAVVPFANPPYNFLMSSGLWIHRPSHEVSGPFADNEWAEITHCSYVLETVSEQTPMWFLAVVGSGVRINVGRTFQTAVLREPIREGCNHQPFSICDSNPDQNAHLAHAYLVNGQIDTAASLLGIVDITVYDSIQFPHYGVASWRGSQFTEIIMLKMSSERDYLYQHISHPALRCGPPASLRACLADDPAITQQAEVCLPPMQGAFESITRQAGCPTQ